MVLFSIKRLPGTGFLRVYIEEIKRELVRTFEIVRYLGGAGFKGC